MTLTANPPLPALCIAAATIAATLFAITPLDAHARRGAAAHSTTHDSSHAATHTEESGAQKLISGVTATIRHKSAATEPSDQSDQSEPGNTLNAETQPSASAATDTKQRQEKLDLLAAELKREAERKQQAETQRKAEQEVALKLKEERLAARRQAQEEAARERTRLQEALERQCVIKPVMTDQEITLCKSVWH